MYLFLVAYHFIISGGLPGGPQQSEIGDGQSVLVIASTEQNARAAVQANFAGASDGGTLEIENVNEVGGPAFITGS